MRSKKSSSCYLIKKDYANGGVLNKKNRHVLEKYAKEYSIPFYNKDEETIQKKMEESNYNKIIKEFKPFLSNKKSSAYFINNIALMSLAGIERMMNIENENNSLKSYLKLLEDDKAQSLHGNINTSIDVAVSFSMEYLHYVQKYGKPMDGIFDPVKLAEFL
jgi:hypothetical protein